MNGLHANVVGTGHILSWTSCRRICSCTWQSTLFSNTHVFRSIASSWASLSMPVLRVASIAATTRVGTAVSASCYAALSTAHPSAISSFAPSSWAEELSGADLDDGVHISTGSGTAQAGTESAMLWRDALTSWGGKTAAVATVFSAALLPAVLNPATCSAAALPTVLNPAGVCISFWLLF